MLAALSDQGLASRKSALQDRAMKIGYARVSTLDQNPDLQTAALKKAGCRKLFIDHGRSGASFDRPELTLCLKSLRAGDVLVVWKLDRLGRSLKHLLLTIDELQSRKVGFQSITENIDTGSAAGRMLLQLIGALAEFERSLIAERTKAGLAAAKRKGVRPGPRYRLGTIEVEHAKKLIDTGEDITTIARSLKVDRATLYRAFHRYERAQATS